MQEIIDNPSRNVNSGFKKITSIDYSCDLAQGYGIYKNEKELEFLDYVSSVNIAAGFHAGDPVTIKEALVKTKEKNLVIGANIGFNDLQGFGMRTMNLSDEETEALVIYQVGALMSFAKAYGLEIEHVRLHGAMYKLASENFNFSCAVAKAIKKCSQWLTYVGAAGDLISKVGEYVQIPVAKEICFNNVYNVDGTINYTAGEVSDYETLTRRLQRYMQYSQIDNVAKGNTFIDANTIHFSTDSASLELIKKANIILAPKPVNYNKVENSGWV